jgi:hypothetical protein
MIRPVGQTIRPEGQTIHSASQMIDVEGQTVHFRGQTICALGPIICATMREPAIRIAEACSAGREGHEVRRIVHEGTLLPCVVGREAWLAVGSPGVETPGYREKSAPEGDDTTRPSLQDGLFQGILGFQPWWGTLAPYEADGRAVTRLDPERQEA